MAKTFVKISLATKIRLLLGSAVVCIIAAALLVPWYFMELLSQRGAEKPARILTELRLTEWRSEHMTNPDAPSDVASLYAGAPDAEGRKGPLFIPLAGKNKRANPDSQTLETVEAFGRNENLKLAVIRTEDQRDREVYRCFRAVRNEGVCIECHKPTADKLHMRFQPGQLVGVVEVMMPEEAVSGNLIWWTRGAFVVGGALAGLLAVISLAAISQRIIIRPVRKLRTLADRVAEGDLTVRSGLHTGDEFQRLGDSFNEMLTAINQQHDRLRSANRALDLRLSELAEANVALFQANKIKTEFLANVSHELRTPLNSIIGFADLLKDSADQRTGRYAENISAAANNLLKMINDILDLARIEAGKAEINLEKVSVSDACQTIASLMKPQADKKHLELESQIDDNLPIITSDAGKIQQILYNLTSNAIKFTPSGGKVTITAKAIPSKHRGGDVEEVSVAVSDTGPGIPEADRQHIFEKFYQSDKALTKEAPGTGLGLAISKELTNFLRGRLTLDSSPGHGTTFTLILPVEFPHQGNQGKENNT